MLDRAPSAVLSTEVPLVTLVAAWFNAEMSAFMDVAMARPEASSFALTIREPLDSLARDSLCAAELLFR